MNSDSQYGNLSDPKPVIKLKITRKDGTTEVIEVTDYAEWNVRDIVPVTVFLGLTISVSQETFIRMIRSMKVTETSNVPIIRWVYSILKCRLIDAKELVESL